MFFARLPYQATETVPASVDSGEHPEVGSNTPILKQEVICNKQTILAKAELRAKQASRWTASSMPQNPSDGKVLHSLHIPVVKTATIRQAARSTESITIRTSEHTIKTANSSVKAMEHMDGTAIKPTQVEAETVQKTIVEAARSAQRIRAAPKALPTLEMQFGTIVWQYRALRWNWELDNMMKLFHM